MVEAMYENSPEYFKKFQKRFKYTICDIEPKPQDSGIENYAYGYDSLRLLSMVVRLVPVIGILFLKIQVRKIILFFLRMLLRRYFAL